MPEKEPPLWKGPEVDGVTQSMLSKFLSCRERFRLYAVEGIRTADCFNHKMEFGQLWHACEEDHAAGRPISKLMEAHAKKLVVKYPTQRDQINHWYRVCKMMFPVYAEHWASHPDVLARTPLLEEKTFDVWYQLPNGRWVRLRGKWDSVDLVDGSPMFSGSGVVLQENKSKSAIDRLKLERQLKFDLQTGMYLVVLQMVLDGAAEEQYFPQEIGQLRGVRYNVVKRSAHRQGKKETTDGFIDRLRGIIVEEPHEWFARWMVEVSKKDVLEFRKQLLDPLLESLCSWYDWVSGGGRENPFSNGGGGGLHWRHPFGVYNILDEGGSSDLDAHLESGSMVGLVKAEKLFTELEEPNESMV